jgi:hypothetical protein
VRITLFGVEEANRLIGEIRPQMEKLRGQKRELDRLETRLDVLRIATAGAAPSNADTVELRTWTEKRARLADLIRRGVLRLQERGVLVKDLDQGLCDFHALMGDRLIFLCWHLGEPEITHWHTLGEGFAGRRPLKSAERE